MSVYNLRRNIAYYTWIRGHIGMACVPDRVWPVLVQRGRQASRPV